MAKAHKNVFIGLPKIFAKQRFLGKGAAGVVSVAVAVKQLPAKCAPIGPPKKDEVFFWGK